MSSFKNERPPAPQQPIRLRQIALVARDLKESERLLTKVLGTPVIYQDPHVTQWGLKNILLCFGGNVLEVVSPFQPGTTAGRLLDKRGDGGYMIIMQTINAALRRDFILNNTSRRVITNVETEQSTLVQYHPRGIKGGVMPELDSHKPTAEWPAPLFPDVSPWMPLGPMERSPMYMAAMRDASWLRLVGVILRLEDGDEDTVGAAKQWEETFGCVRTEDMICYINARMGFVAGRKGEPDGIHSITLAVEGKQRVDRIKWAAESEGVLRQGPPRDWYIEMLGILWYFVETTG